MGTSVDRLQRADHELLSGHFWGELRIFAEVARAKSFNRAAERLGVSQPTVSRKVKRLEDQVGSQLLIPTKLGIRLTQRGEELAHALVALDHSLYVTTNNLRAESEACEGLVSLSIDASMASFLAIPSLTNFAKRFPRVRLYFKEALSINDLRESQSDLMIGRHPAERPDIVCKPLGSLRFTPVATRTYVERFGVATRRNLESHQFLQSRFFREGDPLWSEWQRACARGQIAHFCDDTLVYGALAEVGAGIALLGSHVPAIKDAISLDIGCTTLVPLYGLALAGRLNSRPVRLVFEWICDLFSSRMLSTIPLTASSVASPCGTGEAAVP